MTGNRGRMTQASSSSAHSSSAPSSTASSSSAGPAARMPDTAASGGRRWLQPIAERRVGDATFKLFPAGHATADLEIFIAIAGALVVAGLLLLPLEAIAPLLGSCNFRSLTGYPCISCGMTRGILAISHGHFLEAIRLNPLFISPLLVGLLYTPVAWLIWLRRWPRPRISLTRRGKWIFAGTLVLLVLINWSFLISEGR